MIDDKKDIDNLDNEALDTLESIKTSDNDIASQADNEELNARMADLMALAAAADSQRRDDNVDQRLKEFIERHDTKPRCIRLWPVVVAVAACVAILLTVVIWKGMGTEGCMEQQNPIVFSIAKPKADVQVKSENGRKISRWNCMKEELVVDEMPAAEERLVVDVPQGEKLTVSLPDGTKVYLHAGSSLKFPTRFNDSLRVVELKGEAYFAVAKNKEKPFVVKTSTMQTTVLGTEFNVKALGTSDDNVVLVSGSVSVAAASSSRIIRPGQMLKVGNDGRLAVEEVDVTPYTCWRDGYIYFDDITLKDALIYIAREFNYDVEFHDSSLLNMKIHFVADRNEGIKGIVENLNMMNLVDVKIDSQRIKVSGSITDVP